MSNTINETQPPPQPQPAQADHATKTNQLPINPMERKVRFGWVKRLMQTRQPPRQHNLASRKPIDYYERAGKPRPTPDLPTPKESRNLRERSGSASSSPSQVSSAQTVESDNISTTPLKSIMSVQSTKSPSILSGDMNSYNASTVETTVSHQSPPVITVDRAERDSESIVTLASSSRRTRRRSIDTNCSTAGIPPASIMERLNDE